jgi:hypothetical protein
MSDSNNIITIETDPEEHSERKRRKGEAGLQAIDILGRDGEVKRTHRFEMPAKPTPTPRAHSSNKHNTHTQPATSHPSDKVIEIPDPKSVKQAIVENWHAYNPKQVIALMRKCYPNTATASSQLSNLKSVLAGLGTRAPPEDWLHQLRLSRKEYKELANAYREKRDKEGKSLRIVHDADMLVQRALEMITSSDYRVLWPAVILCSGLRPAEILSCNIKETPDSTNHIHPGWWVCISNWAKKGKPEHGRDFCRDHPLLCPAWLWVRAVKIVRAYFCKTPLTKRQMSQRYSKYQLQLLSKGFPNLVNPTHVLFRRFYAKYSFLIYREDFPGVIGENAFITHVLGHTSTEPSLSYINLHLRGAGKLKLKLFDVGKSLQVPVSKRSPKVDKRKRPRAHTDLEKRKV